MKHRRPNLPHWGSAKGFCRWCGEAVLYLGMPTKRQWHTACVKAYKIACWPADTRFHTWVKDRGICQGCNADLAEACSKHEWNQEEKRPADYFRDVLCSWAPQWQADHIIPLVESNPSDLSFWSLSNLRILCTECHKRETAALAARRAQQRREAKQPSLQLPEQEKR